MTIDLDFVLPKNTDTLEIMHNEKGTGWLVEFAGPAHPKTVAWANEAARKSLRKAEQLEQAQANGKKYKVQERTPEDVKRENVQWIVARIVDWSPVSIGGTEYKFSDSSAVDLLSRPDMGWALVQMVEFLTDNAAFTKDSASN